MANFSRKASAVRLPVVSGDPDTGYYTPSHLTRFAQCPLSYRLHHVDRFSGTLEPERSFGLVLHRALEETVREHLEAKRNGVLDAELATEAYRAAWIESRLTDHALFVEGLEILRRWLEREGAVDASRVAGAELPFTLHVDGVALRGNMNRVDRIGDDTIRIRDYTSSRLPTRREARDPRRPSVVPCEEDA